MIRQSCHRFQTWKLRVDSRLPMVRLSTAALEAAEATASSPASRLDTREARRAHFDKIYESLGLRSMEDWYNVTSKDVLQFGRTALNFHQRSLSRALEDIYNDHTWESWRFSEGGTNRKLLWDEHTKRREFLERIRKDLEWKSLSDLYKLSKQIINHRGGASLLRQANNSLARLVQSAYPEHDWIPWKFAHIGPSTWAEEKNVRKFFDYCQKELQLQTLDDWYQVPAIKIASLGGRSLLVRKFKNSLPLALKAAFPEHEWLEWKFRTAPMGWWKDAKNQRRYIEWLGEKVLHVKSMEDWYKLTKEQVTKNYGMHLIAGYHSQSCVKLLRSVFPHHDWLEWKFQRSSKGFWTNPSNRRRFVEYLIQKKGINIAESTILDVEKSISLADIEKEGGSSIFLYHTTWRKALEQLFPELEASGT